MCHTHNGGRAMVDNLLMIGFGILVALMGYGKIPVSKDPSKNTEYLDKFGKFLRVGGLILTAFGLLLAIAGFFRT
jgi:hypothetical protein